MKVTIRVLNSLIAASFLSWAIMLSMILPWSHMNKSGVSPTNHPDYASFEIARWVVLIGMAVLFYRWSRNKAVNMIVCILSGFSISFMGSWILLVHWLREGVADSAVGSVVRTAVLIFAGLTLSLPWLFYRLARGKHDSRIDDNSHA